MAVSVVTVDGTGQNMRIFDVEATADGDTTATIAHGLSFTPDVYSLTSLQQAPGAASAWAVTSVNGTNIVLTKSTAAGSGAAGAQVRLFVGRWHSIQQ